MNSDDVRREEAAQPRDGALPQGSDAVSLRPDPALPPREFAERVVGYLREMPEPFTRDQVARFVGELIRLRESALIDRCRRAIQAERNYQNVLNARVGSKYGADRRNRELDAASRRREQTAQEIEL